MEKGGREREELKDGRKEERLGTEGGGRRGSGQGKMGKEGKECAIS